MPYIYWESKDKLRVFCEVKKAAELRKIAAWNLPEGACRIVGGRTYMHLPDKPILALNRGDSVLQPAAPAAPAAPTTPAAPAACAQSDILF